MGNCLPAILLGQRNDGGTHNHSVGRMGQGGRLVRSGDAEAYGTGQVRVGLLGQADHPSHIGGDLPPHAGHPQGRDAVEEPLRLPGNHSDASL